jgi:hypothetical protein
VIVIDSLLVGGLRFVFDKLAQAVDAELTDDTVLREELLAAQMRLELGEITEDEFAEVEAGLLARIREVRERHTASPATGDVKLAGVEATFEGEEHGPGPEDDAPPGPVPRPPAARRPRRRG